MGRDLTVRGSRKQLSGLTPTVLTPFGESWVFLDFPSWKMYFVFESPEN